MSKALIAWRKYRARILRGLAAPVLFSLLGADVLPETAKVTELPVAAVAPTESTMLTLSECQAIALEKQPALAAHRASLAAAQARYRAVEHLRLTSLISHDLPYRRKQAAISVGISEAAITQAEGETKYAVTRTYLTAVYARQQLAVADRALENLKQMQEGVKRLLDAAAPNATTRDLDRIAVYIPVAQGRREEAVQGLEQAMAALREAMGVGADFQFQLADKQLPWPKPEITKEEVVSQALARRGEMIQASGAVDLTCLEVKAQGTSRHLTMKTFASAGDIHARVVPQGISNGEYRPGAVPLEMPPMLVGSRSARVQQASNLHARAVAVAEKARNLITLEAESTYYKWLEGSRKVAKFREAAESAEKFARSLRDDLEKPGGVRILPEQVLNSGVLAVELRVRANEALFHYLLSLAALDRVTAGGVTTGLDPVLAR